MRIIWYYTVFKFSSIANLAIAESEVFFDRSLIVNDNDECDANE